MSTIEEDFRALKRLHESANKAITNLVEEKRRLVAENVLLNAKLINCQKALDINKEIMRSALTEQNKTKDEYIAEIQILRNKLKELNGYNDNLGH
jgi:hypothetical protein